MKDTVSHYVPPHSPLTSTEPQVFSNNLTMPVQGPGEHRGADVPVRACRQDGFVARQQLLLRRTSSSSPGRHLGAAKRGTPRILQGGCVNLAVTENIDSL
jgi:hypothetical protein